MNRTMRLVLFLVFCGWVCSSALWGSSGKLYLDVVPRSAICYIDGQLVTAGQTVSLEKGTHQLKVEHYSYPAYAQDIQLIADSTCVKVYPVKIGYSPAGARIYIDGELARYQDGTSVYALSGSGVKSVRVRIGSLSKKTDITVNGYSEASINVQPRDMQSTNMFTLCPEVAWYPESDVKMLHSELLGMVSEGTYGKTKFHWGISFFDAAIGRPESYFISLASLEAGLNYNTQYTYDRFSLVYKLYFLPYNYGSKAEYVADDTSMSEYYGYEVYRIHDNWCTLKSSSGVKQRLAASYTHFFEHGLSVILSAGLSMGGYYIWYNADNWDSPESERTYLSKKEIRQISPFVEGTQPFISLGLRLNLLQLRNKK